MFTIKERNGIIRTPERAFLQGGQVMLQKKNYPTEIDQKRRTAMKKSLKRFILSFMMVAFAFAAVPVVKAQASVSQTGATQNALTVQWTPESKALRYYVYVGDDSSTAKLYATLPASATSATISGLPAGSKKYVKVMYDYQGYSKVYTYTAGSVYDAKTIPGKVTGLRQSKWWYFIKKFDATWDRQSGADGYEWIVYKSNGKKLKTGVTSYNSSTPTFSSPKISNNMVYSAKVRAYSTINGKKYTGAWSDASYFFTQPRVTRAKVSGSKLNVKWKKVSGATGYTVYVSTKPKSGYKKVKTVGKNTSSVTISKLKGKKFSPKKKYYVYVTTNKKVGKRKYDSGRLYYWDTKSPTSRFNYF